MIRPDQIKCVFRYIFVFVSCVFSYWVIHETLSYNALCDSIRDDENVTLWTTAHQFTNSHSMDRRYGPSSCHSDVSRGSGIFHQIAFAPHFMVLRYIFHVMQFIKTTCFAVERRNSRNKLHSDTMPRVCGFIRAMSAPMRKVTHGNTANQDMRLHVLLLLLLDEHWTAQPCQ